jgi:hypothetical protein
VADVPAPVAAQRAEAEGTKALSQPPTADRPVEHEQSVATDTEPYDASDSGVAGAASDGKPGPTA